MFPYCITISASEEVLLFGTIHNLRCLPWFSEMLHPWGGVWRGQIHIQQCVIAPMGTGEGLPRITPTVVSQRVHT